MGDELATTIRARIADLVSERERHAQEAQRIDYGYAAAIGELERLLAQAHAREDEDYDPAE